MRQIEDRWRINVRELPNNLELYSNMINNYQFNDGQLKDIRNYASIMFRRNLTMRCSDICLQNTEYTSCLSNCYKKHISSKTLMSNTINQFQKSFKEYEDNGRNYFTK